MKRKHIGIIKRYNISLNNFSSTVNYCQGLIKIFYKSYSAIAINIYNNNAVLLPVYRKFQYMNMELELLVRDDTIKIFFRDIKTQTRIAAGDCSYHEI